MRVTLRSITQDAEYLIAECARVSRRGDGKPTDIDRDRATIGRLIRDGHDSVLEHASATFLIDGISRACMDQLLRHRHMSATAESQRYVDQTGAGYTIPRHMESFAEELYRSVALYERLVKTLEIPEEDARYVLPMAMHTRVVVTANFREWRHIIRLRAHPAAQWEIRELVAAIRDILVQHAPSVFGNSPEIPEGSAKEAR